MPFTASVVVAQLPALVVVSPVSAGVAEQGSAVALLRLIAEGVPSAGVTKVGEVASTTLPLPVVDEPIPASASNAPLASANFARLPLVTLVGEVVRDTVPPPLSLHSTWCAVESA